MWRFLFIKLFHTEIMTLNDNFNKLADEQDKLRQQFNRLEMSLAQYFYPIEREIAEIKTSIQVLEVKSCIAHPPKVEGVE